MGEIQPSPVENLVFVFVKLGSYGTDRFFICTWPELCGLLLRGHSEYLAKHDGVRPKRWDSLHISISVKEISHFEDRWDIIEDMLK